ncbi:efflux RND transporter permease subunit [Polymorphobacter fuscus]|uniref:Acriflavine resistance protein B n=1 Tax=Sandarakinorhabdus fusca TaxID=1439888 RepID=A0A7C9KKY5_9SPHN|nr:efflux RND transporter permease subunit [Polymorphobacter fuscus]KAB7648426.1 efflux RND transporter permease subunit [Polymorphobacter fuscus]MQT15944.1 acriflavine resistance protein B [Polymorphobacter fuscus]NJC07780.1 HAE1 family hydrophobic/amphiphilic exporter-1 [Polymorphobacter fuscus]
MGAVRLAVERPVATVLLSLAIIFAGFFGYRQLPVSALPEIDLPTIQISANLPGANPATMAASVATPIERQLSTIAGIDLITSSSSTGSTNITIQFALDRNIDAAALDVQTALSAVTRRLPREMPAPPTFKKVNPADQAVLILSVQDRTRPENSLQTIVDTLIVPRISTMSGVGEIQTYGSRRFAMRIQFDPAALTARNLTADDVRNAVVTANSNVAVGAITGGDRSYILDATGNLETPEDFAAIVIASRDGLPVRLGDVATVSASYEQLRGGAKFNGEPSLTLAITRQPGANVVKLVDDVLAVLPSIKQSIPESVNITPVVDRSESVRHSVADAQYTLVGTAILVIIVIYLVLGDWRATIIPAVVLPLAAIGTFAGMHAFGFNLDNLSLLALTLATGFVVDDAIVVLENIVRHIEDGAEPREAAVTGANEIAFTVLSISVSLVAVFIPLLFMGGVIGRLFFEFAVTMTIAIGISAVLSLTLIPMIAARVLKPGHAHDSSRVARVSTAAFGRLTGRYMRAFDATLRHRKLVGFLTVASIGVAVWGFTVVPKGFFPTEDTGAIFIGTEAAPDIGFAEMLKKQDAVARIVRADPAVARVNSFLGGGTGNTGRMFAPLKDRSERDSAEVVQARLRKELSQIPGISAFPNIPQNLQMGGRASSSNYQYTLSSVDKDALYDFAPRLEARLRGTPGFDDVSSDYQKGAREVMISIDRDAASRLGVPVSAIRQTLYAAYGNEQVSTIYTDADSYQVILEIAPSQQMTPDGIGRLTVRATSGASVGQLVPLSAVVRSTIQGAPSVVAHQSQLPAVTISFNLAKGTALSQAKPLIDAAATALDQPATISGAFGGNAQQFGASTDSMPILFLAAIIVIYIVLGVLYESFAHPITILSGLPAAGIGAVAFLWLFNKPLDVIGIIGVVLLIGIVKKNAIMMIDFALAGQRSHGWTPVHAIREAASKRFRPIMMTTFAAMAAALPLALGLGAGAELRQPLGIAVLGGLVVSQVLTLFITPVVYLGIEGINARLRARRGGAQVRSLPTGDIPDRVAAE